MSCATSPEALMSSANSQVFRSGVAAFRRASRLLDHVKAAVEHARPGYLLGSEYSEGLVPANASSLSDTNSFDAPALVGARTSCARFSVRVEDQIGAALRAHCNTHTFSIHFVDGAQRRTGRNEVGRLDLEIAGRKIDLVRALRFDREGLASHAPVFTAAARLPAVV